MKEILTLQVGGFANHVGAQFWSSQNELLAPAFSDGSTMEIDPTILFSQSVKGDIFPRALMFDFRDSSGIQCAQRKAYGVSFKESEKADVEGRSDDMFAGMPSDFGSSKQVEESSAADYSLTDESSWGELLQATVSPNNLVGLGGRNPVGDRWGTEKSATLSSSTSSFDAFTDGLGLINDAIEDAIRRSIEDCDSPQGVQLLFDADSGFAGVAYQLASHLQEDMSRTPLFAYALQAPGTAVSTHATGASAYTEQRLRSMRYANWAHVYHAFCSSEGGLDALFVPLSLAGPQWAKPSHLSHLKTASQRHAAAVTAAAIDVFTSATRASEEYRDAVLPIGSETLPEEWNAVMKKHDPTALGAESVAAFSKGVSMSTLQTFFKVRPAQNLLALALSYPSPFGKISPQDMHSILTEETPAHKLNGTLWKPLLEFSHSLTAFAAPPFAHASIVRGVGCHSIKDGAYTHALPAYGAAWDAYLSRSECHTAGHALYRTPLPVSIAHPRVFSDEELPLCIPSAVHAIASPLFSHEVGTLLHCFDIRDKSTAYRYVMDDGSRYFSDQVLQDSLRDIIDAYAPADE